MRENPVPFIVCGLIAFFLSGCYYLQQGSTLLKYHCNAQSNRTVIADSATPQKIRFFLSTVEDIRLFAFENVGLKKNSNFSCFVKINRDYLIDNVYAAESDTFAQYLWRYPFLGAMPYKGFFDRSGAEKEASGLREKGYDVFIGEVNGFSTLGILRDPVYSFMEKYGPFSLSSLIFHELAHSTIFIKNQSQFNEEAATFIGREAGLRYVEEKYGHGSGAYRKAMAFNEDENTYYRLINDLCRKLDSIYRNERSRDARIALKNDAINCFKQDIMLKYDSLFKTDGYKGIGKATINNATLMIAMTYTLDLDVYYELYRQCGNDLKSTIAALIELRKMKGDPKKNLREKLLKQDPTKSYTTRSPTS
jgi:predicted aminopeptidase